MAAEQLPLGTTVQTRCTIGFLTQSLKKHSRMAGRANCCNHTPELSLRRLDPVFGAGPEFALAADSFAWLPAG